MRNQGPGRQIWQACKLFKPDERLSRRRAKLGLASSAATVRSWGKRATSMSDVFISYARSTASQAQLVAKASVVGPERSAAAEAGACVERAALRPLPSS